MQAAVRLVAMLLAVTLAGGAQACMALCITPAKATAQATPQKPACHHCSDKPPAKPLSNPGEPCRHCPTASQDRLATESDHSILKTAVEFTLLPQLDLTPATPTIARGFIVTPPHVHSPPGDLLHQFCLLLI